MANAGGYLTPGFFARVRIPGSGQCVATLVPDSAVITDQNQKVLYVVGPENLVEVRPVKLGAVFGELRSIESGIDVNDRVIINGLMQARPGAKVNPQEGSIPLDSLPPAPGAMSAIGAQSTAPQPATPERSGP